jgi:tellurite resistance protein TehA-like permease
MTIILITILGAIASLIIGSIWYSDKTPMGRLHMQSLGFDKLSPEEQKQAIEKAKPHMWKSFLGQFILSGLTAFFIAFITVNGLKNGETLSMVIGYALMGWICFIVPVIGSGIIWSNTDKKIVWKKFGSEILNYLLNIIIIVLIAKLFV